MTEEDEILEFADRFTKKLAGGNVDDVQEQADEPRELPVSGFTESPVGRMMERHEIKRAVLEGRNR